MKINGGGSVKPTAPASASEVTAGKQTSGPQAPAAPSSSRSDKVEITPLSAQIAQLEKVLADVGVVDTAHVEAIKAAISEGRFQVNSDVVADKLLTTVREYLLTQQKS